MGKLGRGITSIARFLDALDKPQPKAAAESLEASQQEVRTTTVRSASAVSEPETSPHPTKRRKTGGTLSSERTKYDATDLVTRYTDESQVPEHLLKCASIVILIT